MVHPLLSLSLPFPLLPLRILWLPELLIPLLLVLLLRPPRSDRSPLDEELVELELPKLLRLVELPRRDPRPFLGWSALSLLCMESAIDSECCLSSS